MPNVSTVGPGQDFSTLQAWENFADGQPTADQWAEGYSGANLGAVVVSDWTATPTASLYPRIYVASGHGHNADWSSGAYSEAGGASSRIIDVNNLSYVQIEGLRIRATGNSAFCVYTRGTIRDMRIEKLLLENTGTSGQGCYFFSPGERNDVINCINRQPDSGTGFRQQANSSAFNVYNCVAYRCSIGYHRHSGFLNVRNCLGLDCVTQDINPNVTNSTTCMTTDGTGGDPTLRLSTDLCNDPANGDFSLKDGSAAIDAGTDYSGIVDDDIIGTPRPQGSAYDIGAYEKIVAAGGPFPHYTRRRMRGGMSAGAA